MTQVVSPGIPYDLEKADSKSEHYICSAFVNDDSFYLVALDFTTGAFRGHVFENKEEFLLKLRSFEAKEFITYMGQWEKNPEVLELLDSTQTLLTHLSEEYFLTKFTEIYIEKLIPSYKRDKVISTCSEILAPIGALAYYICSTQTTETLTLYTVKSGDNLWVIAKKYSGVSAQNIIDFNGIDGNLTVGQKIKIPKY